MKFVSFNINGLRARPHQLAAIVEKHQPDVIGLQETKVHDDMFPLEEVAKLGYNVFYHGQKGHYGVALLTKETPIAVRRGFPGDDEEAQLIEGKRLYELLSEHLPPSTAAKLAAEISGASRRTSTIR